MIIGDNILYITSKYVTIKYLKNTTYREVGIWRL